MNPLTLKLLILALKEPILLMTSSDLLLMDWLVLKRKGMLEKMVTTVRWLPPPATLHIQGSI